MYKALIHSVPGSGTRFTFGFLVNCLGYNSVSYPLATLLNYPTTNVYLQSHAGWDIEDALGYEDVRMIIPLRFPYHTYITRRSSKGAPPEGMMLQRRVHCEQWKDLIEIAERRDPLFVPVEAGLDRRWLLQSIATYLEAPVIHRKPFEKLVKEWPKIGGHRPRPDRITYDQTGLIDGQKLTFLDFAVDWYEEIVARLHVQSTSP